MIPPGRNECLEYLNKLAEARRGDTTTSLLDLLVEGRKFEATDPRDKIYAFLGIHSDTHGKAPLPVDYSLPVSKVYQQAAIHILETSDNLDLLLNCGSFRKQANPGYPTGPSPGATMTSFAITAMHLATAPDNSLLKMTKMFL
jgi:hypothetical protein